MKIPKKPEAVVEKTASGNSPSEEKVKLQFG
jgi:hypothetical protein